MISADPDAPDRGEKSLETPKLLAQQIEAKPKQLRVMAYTLVLSSFRSVPLLSASVCIDADQN